METSDYQVFPHLSSALWADENIGGRITLDTFAAVSLMNLPRERMIERVAAGILDHAVRDGQAEITYANLGYQVDATSAVFFRLSPVERFALMALHSGQWSYARLGRVMRIDEARLQEIAWKARIHLAQTRYPSGPKLSSLSCPEYVSHRPWTQKFLDEELSTGSERVFMQNHLLACDSCREALNRCRDLYYAVESKLPKPRKAEALVRGLAQAERSREKLGLTPTDPYAAYGSQPIEVGFVRSLRVFGQRGDVKIALALVALLIVWKVFS